MPREIFAFFAHRLSDPLFKLRLREVVVINPVFVAGVIRRINVDAFDPTSMRRQQRFKREQIVALDD